MISYKDDAMFINQVGQFYILNDEEEEDNNNDNGGTNEDEDDDDSEDKVEDLRQKSKSSLRFSIKTLDEEDDDDDITIDNDDFSHELIDDGDRVQQDSQTNLRSTQKSSVKVLSFRDDDDDGDDDDDDDDGESELISVTAADFSKQTPQNFLKFLFLLCNI